ncbi:MAG: restriction endonuclease subunit S [Saccharofermentanales bacterium]
MLWIEHRDAWAQRKLGNISKSAVGGGTPDTSNSSYWNGSIPWLQSSDLIENQISDVRPKKHITQAALTHSATKRIPANSLTIIIRVGVGKLAIIPFEFTTSQDFLSLYQIDADLKFLSYIMLRKLNRELHEVQGTSIKGITKSELLEKNIYLPNKPEQKKLGEMFFVLDNLLTLHKRKCELLKNIKKSLLEKMFPKNGSVLPEVRFKGFTDAWEQRKLGDIATEITRTDAQSLIESV